MAKYRVCEYCGANLDFGEKCDCCGCEEAKDTATPCAGGEVTADGTEECYTQ